MDRGGRRSVYGRNKFTRNDGWNTVLSRRQVRQEKLCFNKELRLPNATSFFISILPDTFNRAMLWKAFEHWKISKMFPDKNLGKKTVQNLGARSYRSVLSPNLEDIPKTCIELPPMNVETKKRWEYKSLVGEAKDIDILNSLKKHLSGIMDEGWLRCGKKWFSRLYVWEGVPPVYERIAWIKILGVPVSLWDRHVFNRVGERCGHLLVKSEADADDGNLAEERVAILGKELRRNLSYLGRIR
ncbi:hypothetical protein Hanom_Chr10g00913451 [Helianthus anomalus]